MSCGVGCRRGSDPALLCLWRRPVATAPIQPLAWEPPYAAGAAQEIATTTTTKKTKKDKRQEKEEQKSPKVSRRKEIIKIKEEINKIETQKTTEKINKTKS